MSRSMVGVTSCELRVHSVAHRPDDPHRRNCQPAARRLSWLLVICSSAIRKVLSVSWRMHLAKLGAGPYRLLVFSYNLAVKQMHRSLRVLGESAVMGNHANGCSTLMQLGEKLHDGIPVLAV